MRTKVSILLFSLFFVATSLFAQESGGKQKKADKSFSNYSYSKAIERYETMDPKTTDINRKLAQSYYSIGDNKNAEKYYAVVSSAQDHKSTDLYYYAEVLQANGKYLEANSWMDKYNSEAGSDTRAKNEIAQKMQIKKFMEDEGRYRIKLLDINTVDADFGPSYYKDKVVFASSRSGVRAIKREYNWNGMPYLNLYVAKVGTEGQLSDASNLNKKLNTKYHEGPACFSKDGNTMYFTRNNYYKGKAKKSKDGIINLKLFYSEFKDEKWQQEKEMPFNSDDYSVGHPSLSADGSKLFFSSDMPGGKGGVDIYSVDVKGPGQFGTPVNLGENINTEGNEMFPFIHNDGTLYFASNGLPGIGGLDMFISPQSKGAFGKPVNMGAPLNTGFDDFGLITNDEVKKGYFSSNRVNGKGDDDIYYFDFLKPFTFKLLLKGVAKDKVSGTVVPMAKIILQDDAGNKIEELVADKDGNYSFEVDPDKNFKLLGKQDKYFDGANTATTKNADGKSEITADLMLEKDPGLSLYGLVTDAKTKQPLEGVKITIIEIATGKEVISNVTAGTGDFRKPLSDKKVNDKLEYKIKLEKTGYLTKEATFTYNITKPGEIKIHENLDLSIGQIEVGTDLAKLIDIKPIYFDLGKYNIRKDASIELDKIVKVMTEYPTMQIELGSHTDCRASATFNMKLSDNRAKASAAYIKSKISNPERIFGKGYGESKLVNGCACEGAVKSTCTEEEHQKNRRTEFIITKM